MNDTDTYVTTEDREREYLEDVEAPKQFENLGWYLGLAAMAGVLISYNSKDKKEEETPKPPTSPGGIYDGTTVVQDAETAIWAKGSEQTQLDLSAISKYKNRAYLPSQNVVQDVAFTGTTVFAMQDYAGDTLITDEAVVSPRFFVDASHQGMSHMYKREDTEFFAMFGDDYTKIIQMTELGERTVLVSSCPDGARALYYDKERDLIFVSLLDDNGMFRLFRTTLDDSVGDWKEVYTQQTSVTALTRENAPLQAMTLFEGHVYFLVGYDENIGPTFLSGSIYTKEYPIALDSSLKKNGLECEPEGLTHDAQGVLIAFSTGTYGRRQTYIDYIDQDWSKGIEMIVDASLILDQLNSNGDVIAEGVGKVEIGSVGEIHELSFSVTDPTLISTADTNLYLKPRWNYSHPRSFYLAGYLSGSPEGVDRAEVSSDGVLVFIRTLADGRNILDTAQAVVVAGLYAKGNIMGCQFTTV